MIPNCPPNFRFLGCLVIEYRSLVQNEATVVLLSEVPVVLIQKLRSGHLSTDLTVEEGREKHFMISWLPIPALLITKK